MLRHTIEGAFLRDQITFVVCFKISRHGLLRFDIILSFYYFETGSRSC